MAKKDHPMDEMKKMDLKGRTKLNLELEKELAHLRVDLKTGKSKQGHKVKALKKQIARIYTINNNKSVSSSNN